MFGNNTYQVNLSTNLEDADLALAAAAAPVSRPRGINAESRGTTSPRAESDLFLGSSLTKQYVDQSGRPSLRRLGSGEHINRPARNHASSSAMPPPLAPVRAASAERARKAVPVLAVRLFLCMKVTCDPIQVIPFFWHSSHLGQCRFEGQRSICLAS